MNLLGFEQRRAGIIARAALPRGSFNGLVDDRDLGADIARQLQRCPWWSAIVVRLALLFFIWYAPIWRLGKLKTFGALPDPDRPHLLDLLARSKKFWLREMVLLVKMHITFAAVGDPRVLRHLGAYDLDGGPVALRRSLP